MMGWKGARCQVRGMESFFNLVMWSQCTSESVSIHCNFHKYFSLLTLPHPRNPRGDRKSLRKIGTLSDSYFFLSPCKKQKGFFSTLHHENLVGLLPSIIIGVPPKTVPWDFISLNFSTLSLQQFFNYSLPCPCLVRLLFSRSVMSDWIFCDPMDCSLPGSSVHGISREYWSGLPFHSPEYLSHQRLNPRLLH